MTELSLTDLAAGTVVKPGDAEWDAARSFHSGVGEPTIIVRPSSVDDVRAAVRYAASERLDVMVRGGGHSAWGAVPGGVTLDLDALDDIRVDGALVHVGGGATWGAVAAALAEHGLAVSSGDTASVGVGGLTLGGGIGWMVRAWGLAADQLVGAQVVTASGDVLEANDASHSDLLWALRGGGGNFGVVTRFDFRAHPLTSVVFATLGVAGDARPVLRALRDTMIGAPRELTVTYMDVPAMDPSAPAGATITACWIGDDEDAARAALAPLVALDGVTETELGVRGYPDILMDMPAADPDQAMPGFVGGNTLLEVLTDDAIDRLAAFREANSASVLFLRSLGGAFGDVAQDATPFPARSATWFAMAGAFDIPGLVDDGNRPLIQAEWDAIEALGEALYGNFTTSTDPGLVSRIYSPEAIARLAEIKLRLDPQNLFCRNHNVTPA
ncbi:FAD-binding oxidoreductase [Microbacterium flavescens]|uniref:FAD-binding oxidoreductase n=1 Tax=Microbacterium flavescens TaxID=69366 RepID=UPI0027DC67D0|nr:FAD-binding oxidoreductase [Microbacterium flavescens]